MKKKMAPKMEMKKPPHKAQSLHSSGKVAAHPAKAMKKKMGGHDGGGHGFDKGMTAPEAAKGAKPMGKSHKMEPGKSNKDGGLTMSGQKPHPAAKKKK